MLKKLRNLGSEVSKKKGVYLFLVPGFLFFATFAVYPLLFSLRMSFLDWKVIQKSAFVGLQNYIRAFHDPIVGIAFRNTILYGIITVPGQMVLGLGAALLLNRRLRGRVVFRAIYYLPVVTSWVVVALIFKYIFNDQAGVINYLLKDVFHIIPHYIGWLIEPWTALFVVMALGIWKGIGWSMVIFLAGLQSIPHELYEAAGIDGASSLQQFRKITVPLLRSTLVFLLIMLGIGSFNVFISIYVITHGGPFNQTQVVLSWMYTQSFDYLHFGYGAALSWILFAVIFIASFLQYKYLHHKIQY